MVLNKSTKKIYMDYLKNISKLYADPDSTELSYYPALSNLLNSLINDFGLSYREIIVEGKKIGENKPDIRLRYKQLLNLGFGEVKDPKNLQASNLDEILKTQQLKRYRKNFNNLFFKNRAQNI